MLDKMVQKGFPNIENYELLIVDDQIDVLLSKMKVCKPAQVPKWLKKKGFKFIA